MSRIHETFIKRMGLVNLSGEEMERLHLATLDILEDVGVRVCEPGALALLEAAGAGVKDDVVRIPGWMVQQCLQTAPSSINIYNRGGEQALALEKGQIYFGTGSDTPYILDLDSGKRRLAVKADTVRAAIVADALKNIDFIMAMARASDVSPQRTDRHHFEAMVLNSTKPIVFDAHDRQGLLDIIAMAGLVAGGREELVKKPFLIHYAEPSSPLVHPRVSLEKLLTAADEKIPLIYAPAVMCGATGPVTTAGALVVANAEILSGLVIHQLRAPGAPYIYGGGTPPLNMITTLCSYGDPQGMLGALSLVEMAHYYNLPSFTIGGCSDSQDFDQQSAMEAGFTLLMSVLAGGNLIHDLGYIGAGLTGSLEYLVLCDEGALMARYLSRGLEVSPATLALDVIRKVGPGGHFLSDEHTMNHFRSQMHFTRIFNRNNYENWQSAGSRCFGRSANDLVRELLQWHEVPPLDRILENEVRALALGGGKGEKLA